AVGGRSMSQPVVRFDGDGTRWDFDAAMRAALAETLELLRVRRPGPATDELSVGTMVADHLAAEADVGGTVLAVIRQAAFGRTLARLEMADDALCDELQEHYRAVRQTRLRAYPDVRPVLEPLSRTYRLA